MDMLMRDSTGEKSTSVTLLFVSFGVMTLAVIASMFESIGPIALRQINVELLAAYFTPIIALYGGRRWTTAKYGSAQLSGAGIDGENNVE